MELNTITQQEYYQDHVQTNLREIFEPNSYISKSQSTPFDEIKTKISQIIQNIISPEEINLNSQINEKFLELDFGSEFDIDATKIGINDAIFFINLLNNNGIINYTTEDNSLNITDVNNKKINATTSLINMLQTSINTNKPIRLDFDKDITVILKLDKEGKIQAHFIPGSSEVESYLKNNISCLKQAFDDEEINYSHLGYSKYKNNENENQNKNENGQNSKNNKKRSSQ